MVDKDSIYLYPNYHKYLRLKNNLLTLKSPHFQPLPIEVM
nr:MAG TPA: hypothetical protein [Crassvirales sp.]